MTRSRQFRVVRRSEVSIRGSIRPQLTLYGGQVVGESSVTTIPEVIYRPFFNSLTLLSAHVNSQSVGNYETVVNIFIQPSRPNCLN